jgi:4-hydroxy-2-oxoheptanedioate aldolase
MGGLKETLRAGTRPLSGFINLIPSAVATQALAATGADWVLIDQEHGPIGPESLHAMIAATAGTACAPLVRVPRTDEAFVKSALDAGAEGIVFPLVATAETVAECVALTRYPPLGRRGWGPFVAHSRWGVELFDYLPLRSYRTVCGILIETRSAIEHLEEICKVEGVDFMIIAQFDLSTDLGVPGRFDAPEFRAAVQQAERVIMEHRIPLGGVAMSKEQTQSLIQRGYRVLAHHFDVLMLRQMARQMMEWGKAR